MTLADKLRTAAQRPLGWDCTGLLAAGAIRIDADKEMIEALNQKLIVHTLEIDRLRNDLADCLRRRRRAARMAP